MTDDLVKRLRSIHTAADCDQAADHIEQLVATTEALTAERDQWIQHAKNAVWADSEEVKLLTADNALLRKALEKISSHSTFANSEGFKQIARAALTGKDDT
jgi:hypothetical protein